MLLLEHFVFRKIDEEVGQAGSVRQHSVDMLSLLFILKQNQLF